MIKSSLLSKTYNLVQPRIITFWAAAPEGPMTYDTINGKFFRHIFPSAQAQTKPKSVLGSGSKGDEVL